MYPLHLADCKRVGGGGAKCKKKKFNPSLTLQRLTDMGESGSGFYKMTADALRVAFCSELPTSLLAYKLSIL